METLYQSGDVISDRYRIIAPLGEGGMGITYAAEDLTYLDKRRVAIKVLSLHQAREWKALELFEREARVLKNLAHPAIPKYINSFAIETPQEHRFCLVQQLIQGESLATLVQQGWQPGESQVKDIAVQILDILVYLHSLVPPVIHRDINPRNLIRQPNGKVFLVDFGAVQEIYRNTITQGGTFIGTLGYTALEQFRGQVKPASDLYSLGATLLFLLTGQSPDTLPHQRMKLAFRDQVQISPEFANWLEQMLEPAIEDRFPSAQAARSALPKKPEYSNRLIPPRPSSSWILLYKTAEHLLIHIPPGFTSMKVSPLWVVSFYIFMVGWLMVRFILERAIHNLPILSLIFSYDFLISLLIPIGPIVIFLPYLLYNQLIEIDRQKFRIQYRLFDWNIFTIKGKTADIVKVELYSYYMPKGGVMTGVAIWEGVHKHTFKGLDAQEKRWLVAEISDFLERVRSSD
jgi:serine/threonine protein kinase